MFFFWQMLDYERCYITTSMVFVCVCGLGRGYSRSTAARFLCWHYLFSPATLEQLLKDHQTSLCSNRLPHLSLDWLQVFFESLPSTVNSMRSHYTYIRLQSSVLHIASTCASVCYLPLSEHQLLWAVTVETLAYWIMALNAIFIKSCV